LSAVESPLLRAVFIANSSALPGSASNQAALLVRSTAANVKVIFAFAPPKKPAIAMLKAAICWLMVVMETFPVVPLWTTWKYSGTEALKFAGTFGARPGMSLLTGLLRSTGSRAGPRAVPVEPSDARLSNAESSQKADATADDDVPAPAGAVVAAATARTVARRMRNRFAYAPPWLRYRQVIPPFARAAGGGRLPDPHRDDPVASKAYARHSSQAACMRAACPAVNWS
jgi:hypothetical protein